MKTTAALFRAALILSAVALLAACTSAAGGPGWTFAPLGPTAPPTTAPSPTGSAPVGTVIELEMTASLRFAQNGAPIDRLELTIGETYTFRVTNTAGFVHNIWLGPPDRLNSNDTAGLPGLPDYESGTQEFSWTPTAEAEGWEFGCTVPGHYQAGMKGAIVLTGGS